MDKQSFKIMTKEVLFWTCFFVYTAFSFYLFYRQATGMFLSDMPSYIEGVLGTNARDPYPYRLFFWTVKIFSFLFPIELSAAFSVLLFNSLTVFILRYYIEKYFSESNGLLEETPKKLSYMLYLPVLMTFFSLLASMIVLPFDSVYLFSGQYYIGQGSGNMWHNATYLATRPFATVAFFIFKELLEESKEKINIKKLIVFSIAMFLTVFAKPTFAIVMIPTAVILLIYLLIRERFTNFKNILFLALSFIPAGLDGLRQYAPVFGSSENSGIGFGFADVWSKYTKSIVFSIILCFAFTIYIFICNAKSSEHRLLMLYSVAFVGVSLFEGIFLYEKGIRMQDGNFLQGYLHAMFFLFIVSLIVWLTKRSSRKRQYIYDATALLLFLMHVVSGIWYFVHLLQGNSFY